MVSNKAVGRYVRAYSDTYIDMNCAFESSFPINRAMSVAVTIDGEDVDEPLVRTFEFFGPRGHYQLQKRFSYIGSNLWASLAVIPILQHSATEPHLMVHIEDRSAVVSK
jgi:hypothetical protein